MSPAASVAVRTPGNTALRNPAMASRDFAPLRCSVAMASDAWGRFSDSETWIDLR